MCRHAPPTNHCPPPLVPFLPSHPLQMPTIMIQKDWDFDM